jgi:2-polyprenyl-6-methoxyphenol hydroxylase-like FAD-dependent oxidoreductase
MLLWISHFKLLPIPILSLSISSFKVHRLMKYSSRNELQNFAAYNRDDDESVPASGWRMTSNRETLLHRMRGFHPTIQSLCQQAGDILPLWRCIDRDPLPRLQRGRLVVVGDAAHPMYPHLGSGAAMAIEDAGVLGVLFADGKLTSKMEDIRERLELFEKARIDRVSMVQIGSRVPPLEDSLKEVEGDLRELFLDKDIPCKSFRFLSNRHQIGFWIDGFRLSA